MQKNAVYFVIFIAVVALVIGCSRQESPVESTIDLGSLTGQIVIPENATIQSATLYLYAWEFSGHSINVHRITSDWDELTVNFDNIISFNIIPFFILSSGKNIIIYQ